MMKGRDLSHINSLADLRREQELVQQQLEQNHEALGKLTAAIPARALGATLSWIAGSLMQVAAQAFAAKPTPEPKEGETEESRAKTPLKDKLKAAGMETLFFAAGKAAEILLKR
jgi:hypothetical protein